MDESRLARFRALIDTSGGPDACHPWMGRRNRGGYGCFGSAETAHRIAWLVEVGPIPVGIFVCHRCDNPPCCNVRCLFLGTPADNMRDKMLKGRHRAPFGDTHPGRRLSSAVAAEIRQMYASGAWLQAQLAERFGVSVATISLVLSTKRWAGAGAVEQGRVAARHRAHGERHGMAKLTAADVSIMRDLHAHGRLSFVRLGALFGISNVQAKNVVTGVSWKDAGST